MAFVLLKILKGGKGLKAELDKVKEFWDVMAERFYDYEIPTCENNKFMALLKNQGILDSNEKVLDVGCGAGKYSFGCAPYVKEVIGTDISPNMISYANKRKALENIDNVEFQCISWQEINIEDMGWENKFHLVFAHMTPAIKDMESIEKIRKASKRWCVITKSVYRKNTINDEVNKICGNVVSGYGEEEILQLLKMLWSEGITPEIVYEKENWENTLPVEQSLNTYIKRMSTKKELTKLGKESIEKYIKSIEVNGQVTEVTNAIKCTIYWQENR